MIIDTTVKFIFVKDKNYFQFLVNKPLADSLNTTTAEIIGKNIDIFHEIWCRKDLENC